MPDRPITLRQDLRAERRQDIAAAKVKAGKLPPPTDVLVMQREEAKIASRERRQRRQRRRTKSLEDLVEEPAVPSFLDSLVAADSLRAIMGKVTARQRQILYAIVVADLSAEEVADAFGIAVKTVRAHREQAISKLASMVVP